MLKKLTLVAFAILALATFSACDDGEGDEGAKGPDTNTGALDGACREYGTCDTGLACNTYTKICMKVFVACELGCSDGFECKENGCVEVKPPAPECAVDADCGSDKLCNSGKCEEVGGEEGGDEDGGNGGGGSSGGGNSGGNTGGGDGGGKIIMFQDAQSLLIGLAGTTFKYALQMPITFPDANLKKAVKEAIQKVDPTFNKSDITVADCAKITTVEYHPAWKNNVGCEDKNEIKIKSLDGMENCTGIQHLDLMCNAISNISPLKGLTSLTVLNLWGNQINDISPLKGLTSLTALNLWGNQINDISPLKGLTKLTTLTLGENQNLSNITPLKWLTSLTVLDLRYNYISDISALKNLTNLTTLPLDSNNISDTSALKSLTKLTLLHLSSNKLCDSGAPCAANMNVIAGLPKLTSLDLGANNISNISALKDLTNLTYLNLSYNNISNISALKNLLNLTTLELGYNKDIYDISPLVLNANSGGFSAENSDIYLNGIPAITKIIKKTEIEALEAKGITVHYDGDGK